MAQAGVDQQTDSLGITTTVLPALSSVSRDADALFKLLRAHYGVDDVELTALMGGSAGSDTEAAHARLYERAKDQQRKALAALDVLEARLRERQLLSLKMLPSKYNVRVVAKELSEKLGESSTDRRLRHAGATAAVKSLT